MTPESLDSAQTQVYEEITSGRRGSASSLAAKDGSLVGPFNAMVFAPSVGMALQRLGSSARYDLSLRANAPEVAILLCAHAEESEFEWYAHGPLAVAAGVPAAFIDAIDGGEPVALD